MDEKKVLRTPRWGESVPLSRDDVIDSWNFIAFELAVLKESSQAGSRSQASRSHTRSPEEETASEHTKF